MTKFKTTIEDEVLSIWLEKHDRVCVLIAHAQLEDKLEQLLRQHFIRLATISPQTEESVKALINSINKLLGENDSFAPLGSYAVRARIAFVLGLISHKLYLFLRNLNTLRIECAHFPGTVELKDEQINTLVQSLGMKIKNKLILKIYDGWCKELGYSDARKKFNLAIVPVMEKVKKLIASIQ